MKCDLILFAKPPFAGGCKSRLGRTIGYGQAARLYRRMLRRVMREAEQVSGARLILSVDGDPGLMRRMMPCQRWQVVRQRRGNLGRRMASALRSSLTAQGTGSAILFGSDIPSVGHDDLTAAIQALHRQRFVFGPADDGGYWLIGLSRPDPSLLSFRNVRWSTEHAMSDTMSNLGSGQSVARLEIRPDIDVAEDLTASVLDLLTRLVR